MYTLNNVYIIHQMDCNDSEIYLTTCYKLLRVLIDRITPSKVVVIVYYSNETFAFRTKLV